MLAPSISEAMRSLKSPLPAYKFAEMERQREAKQLVLHFPSSVEVKDSAPSSSPTPVQSSIFTEEERERVYQESESDPWYDRI